MPGVLVSAPAPSRFVQDGWDLRDLHLEGNAGGEIPAENLAWLEPVPADASDEVLRARLARDGVVHIKGVIPRETVLKAREEYFNYVKSTGVLKEGTPVVDGIFCGGDPLDFAGPGVASQVGRTVDDCPYLKLSVEAGMSDFVISFSRDPHIMDMVRRLKPVWKKPILFKRQLLRSNIPFSSGCATKVHYDQIFLRAAPATSLTAWVPMGDITPLTGGLLYLENSVPLGLEIEDSFTKMNSVLSEAERISAFNVNMTERGFLTANARKFAEQEGQGRKWLVGNYEAGDCVFHHPCAIHCSSANIDPQNRIRLATDLRFADEAEAYDYRWAHNFFIPGDKL